MKNKKGFTLIEVLGIVMILALITSISIIAFSKINNNIKKKIAVANFKTIVDAINNEDLLNHKEGEYIEVFSVKDKTNKLKDLIENSSSIQDGLISMYGSYLVQANLCINGYSIRYYYDDNNYSIEKSNKYCNYSDNNGNIITSNINNNNYIAGISWYDKEQKIIESDSGYKSDPTMYPSRLEILKLKEKNLAKSNIKQVNKIEQLASSQKYFSLKDEGYVTSVKNQSPLGICWAYAGVGAIESRVLKKYGENKDFSERQIDYISAYDSFLELENPYGKLIDNYSIFSQLKREAGTGGNNTYLSNIFITGLGLSERKDTNDIIKQDIKKIVDTKNFDNYVTNAEVTQYMYMDYQYTENDIELIVQDIKEKLVDGSALVYNGCVNLRKEITDTNGDKAYIIYSNEYRTIYDVENEKKCGPHAMLLIGWNDDIQYTDENGKKQKGAWILKNSWGEDNLPYLYAGYNITIAYFDTLLQVKDVEKKDWDNTYNFANHSYNYDMGMVYAETPAYFELADNSEEIRKLGFVNIMPGSDTIYLLDMDNKDECFNYNKLIFGEEYPIVYNKDIFSIEKVSDNKFIYNNKEYGGISMDVTTENSGVYFYDVDLKYKFNKGICVVKPKNGAVSILTKKTNNNFKSVKSSLSNAIIVSGYENEYYIDTTTSNIEDGTEVEYIIKDVNGKIVKDVEIENNYIINNIAHSTLYFNKVGYYEIETIVDNTYSDNIVYIGNKNSVSKEKLCTISSSKSILYNNDELTIDVKCNVDGFDVINDEELLKSYIEYDDRIFALDNIQINNFDDYVIYSYNFKVKIDAEVETGIYINNDFQKNYDTNKYFANDLKIDNILIVSKPFCTINSVKSKKIYINDEIVMKVSCGKSVLSIFGIVGIDINSNIDITSNIKVTNPDILKITSIEKGSDSYFYVYLKALKEGKSSVYIEENIVTVNGLGNEKKVSDEIEVMKYDKSSNIECTFIDQSLLFTAKLKKNNSTNINIECVSSLPYNKKINPKITAAKYLGINFIEINSVKYSYSENFGYRYSFNVNITGKKVGFTKLIIEKNSLFDISGYGNKKISSGTIWVRLLGK